MNNRRCWSSDSLHVESHIYIVCSVSHTSHHSCERSCVVVGVEGDVVISVGSFAVDTRVQLGAVSGHLYVEK